MMDFAGTQPAFARVLHALLVDISAELMGCEDIERGDVLLPEHGMGLGHAQGCR